MRITQTPYREAQRTIQIAITLRHHLMRAQGCYRNVQVCKEEGDPRYTHH